MGVTVGGPPSFLPLSADRKCHGIVNRHCSLPVQVKVVGTHTQLLGDPLAMLKAHSHHPEALKQKTGFSYKRRGRALVPTRSFQPGTFQERLCGPLSTLQVPVFPVMPPRPHQCQVKPEPCKGQKRRSRSQKVLRVCFSQSLGNKENDHLPQAFVRGPWNGADALPFAPPGLYRTACPLPPNMRHPSSRSSHSSSNASPDSGCFTNADPDVPSTHALGVAKRVSVALRTFGERLTTAWRRGDAVGDALRSSSANIHSSFCSLTQAPSVTGLQHEGLPSPNSSPVSGKGDMIPRKMVVVALYDYEATQTEDLSLTMKEEYEVLDSSEKHWWKMRDKFGNEGYAPSNYVKEKGSNNLDEYSWYLGNASRQRAEAILMREKKDGCFVVRNSSTSSGMYTLSVFCSGSDPQVKHYHIKTDQDGLFYLSHSIKCGRIEDLIFKHQHNSGGLSTRLRCAPSFGNQAPATAGFGHDRYEIDHNEINLLEELGSGQFGVVRHGVYRGRDVAVKMMKEGTMSEDDFIEEAKIMTKLQHPNLVQLYGVCRRTRPIYIVTEYLENGSLLNYLHKKERLLMNDVPYLLDICLQVCEGMAYLECQHFIHRDLAARNCLVGTTNIKVGDFGLARYVVDDKYTSSGGAKFPIKWAAPEVLNFMMFSSKSDIWAFGVLMWEVFTCGKMPYGRCQNADVVERVRQKKYLEIPQYCPLDVYAIMKQCWIHEPKSRPSFQDLKESISILLEQCN